MRQMHDITKHVLQVLFHHEIFQLLSNKSTSKQQKPDPINLAFSFVISLLRSDPGKLWNSVELYDVYSQSLKLLKDLIMVMRDSTMLMLITLDRSVLDIVLFRSYKNTLVMSHCSMYIRLMFSWSEQHGTGESVIHTAPHKEEGTHRRQLDTTDQAKIANELSKHVIPLATHDTPNATLLRQNYTS